MKKLMVSSLITLVAFVSSLNTANAQFITTESFNEAAAYQTSVSVQDGTKVKVIVNKAEESKLSIRILNAKNETMITKLIGKNEKVSRFLFNLTSLEDGIYQVEISDGSSKQVKQINLKTSQLIVATRNISLG